MEVVQPGERGGGNHDLERVLLRHRAGRHRCRVVPCDEQAQHCLPWRQLCVQSVDLHLPQLGGESEQVIDPARTRVPGRMRHETCTRAIYHVDEFVFRPHAHHPASYYDRRQRSSRRDDALSLAASSVVFGRTRSARMTAVIMVSTTGRCEEGRPAGRANASQLPHHERPRLKGQFRCTRTLSKAICCPSCRCDQA